VWLFSLAAAALAGMNAGAAEVIIPDSNGVAIGAVPVESAVIDRVEAALAPDGRRAAVSVQHGRFGGASLFLLEAGRPARVLLDTGREESLSDPVWDAGGSVVAVVVRGPARRLPGERALRQGGSLWLCSAAPAGETSCARLGDDDDLWRPVAFGPAGRLRVARILPGDLVALEPAWLDLATGLARRDPSPLESEALFGPEPYPPPAVPRDLPHPAPDQPLAMPYIHQVYDTPNEFNGNWACGPTSTLMAIQHFGRLPAWPVTVDIPSPHTSDFGAYVSREYSAFGTTFNRYQNDASGKPAAGAYGWCTEDGAAWAWRMQDYAKKHNLSSDFDGSASFAEVQAAIDAGKVVPLSTQLTSAGHIITVKGYTSDGRLITNDPYGDKNQGYMNYRGEGAIYTWAQVGSKWFITVYGEGAIETDDAAFVAQSVADGSHFLPQTPFVQRWTLRNSGTTTWTRAGNYLLTYDGEERYSAPEQILLPEGASVAPGQTWEFEVPMTSPAAPGTYRGYFRMDRYGVHRFGTRVYLDLVVDEVPDADGDGHRADVDCDDQDAQIHPGAEELCDGRDQDCDGETDEGCAEEEIGPDDGGADAGPDGGREEDGDGGDIVVLSGGCGCAGSGWGSSGTEWLILLPFLVLAVGRKDRPGSPGPVPR